VPFGPTLVGPPGRINQTPRRERTTESGGGGDRGIHFWISKALGKGVHSPEEWIRADQKMEFEYSARAAPRVSSSMCISDTMACTCRVSIPTSNQYQTVFITTGGLPRRAAGQDG